MDSALRAYRQRRDLSTTDVAEMVRVHPMSVSRWERRERLPGPQHIRALATALSVSEADLVAFFDAGRGPAREPGGFRGHGLRSLRRRSGTSVRSVAAHLQVPDSTVYNWEAGRVRIPVRHIAPLALLLRLSEATLTRYLSEAPLTSPPDPATPLRRLRRRSGLSQDRVAQQLGTTRGRIGSWERGATPPLWALRDLARLYGVTLARIAVLVDAPPPEALRRSSWSAGDLPVVLRTLRAWTGLTQREVAHRCGLHVATVRGWENGRAVPTSRSRERIESVYGLQPGALLATYPAD